MRIPFDSLTLRAVIAEIRPYEGAKVQKITQTNDHEVVLELYSGAAGLGALLLSCDPVFARAHLIARRPPTLPEPPAFLAALRARLRDARLEAVRQVGFDRILVLDFGEHALVAELMGKHSNLILLEAGDRVVQAAKTVPPSKSVRPILPGRPYAPPPFPPRPSLLEVGPGENVEGLSPFLRAWLEAGGSLEDLRAERYEPVLVPNHGAYPVSVERLGLIGLPKPSLSVALEQHFAQAADAFRATQLRTSLETGLRRVVLARETALSDLYRAREQAEKAPQEQLLGELILAYGYGFLGKPQIEAWDYEGNPVVIRIDPELGVPENAERYFSKARKAKARQGQVIDQIARLEADLAQVRVLMDRIHPELGVRELEKLRGEADEHRWLHHQTTRAGPAEQPFDGKRVRELLGPHGYRILYGENAEANDYLTLRVARPDDWWLHVRGGVSAHVVVPTGKKPLQVPREVLEFAARIAVRHSPAKHSGYVDVDYTLKKYVRKPRKSPVGTVLYTHEKTITVMKDAG